MGCKKLSLRTCIGCSTVRKKENLLRLSMRPDNQVVIDKKGDLGGRGAYVCNLSCLKTALQENKLIRIFRRKSHLQGQEVKTDLLQKALKKH
ncbi:MAG: DUF448 domain-containing protein [Chloroflexota bacterium]|nr:MAG: DUF448 domain-containing protein [Chloroflexota bacterium]